MRIILLSFFILAVVVGGYILYIEFVSEPEPAKLSAEEWNICEAVIGYELARWTHTKEAFLEVKGRSVPRAFLRRFDALGVSVQPAWRFREGKGRVKFRIDNIERKENDVVEVYGQCVSGPLAAAGFTYRVVRRNGQWIVESDERVWVS